MSQPKTRNLLVLLFVGVLMGALDISIVGPAIPEITKSIHVPKGELSWIFAIYVLFNLVGLPLLARLSDVLGRKLIYAVSLAFFGVGSLVVTLAHNFDLLLIGRAVQGFGSSGVFPVAAAVIGDVFPPEKRGRALGMLGAVFGLAFLFGPILAGVMLQYFEWNALFSINIPVAIMLIIWSIRILPSKKGGTMKKFDWPGMILLGGFLAFFALALNNSDPANFVPSLVSPPVSYYLVISLICFGLLMFAESRASLPVINLALFRRPQIRIIGLIAIGTGMFQSNIVFVPAFVVKAFGVVSSKASFMLIPIVLSTAIGSPLSGRMIDKVGSRAIVLTGIFTAGSGLFIMSTILHSTTTFYIGAVLIGLGLSMLAGPSLRYVILNEVDASERALGQGILTMFFSMGQITGSAIIGAITTSYSEGISGYTYSYHFLTIVTAALLIFAFRLKGRRRERESFA